MLNMKCEGIRVAFDFEHCQNSSFAVSGISRSGKTFFASLLANDLVSRGYYVQIIDLANTWSQADYARFMGEKSFSIRNSDCSLFFPNVSTLVSSAHYITDALGFTSIEAQALIKSALCNLCCKPVFRFSEIITWLQDKYDSEQEEGVSSSRYLNELLFRLKADEVFNFCFEIKEDISDVYGSCVWDFSGLSSDMAKLATSLVLYSNLCLKANKDSSAKTFIFIDEWQNLAPSRNSILGKILTEGAKRALFLVLISQFYAERFSDAVLAQLSQCAFRVTFRIDSGEDARLFARKNSSPAPGYTKTLELLMNLPQGTCFVNGPLLIDGSEVSLFGTKLVVVTDDE